MHLADGTLQPSEGFHKGVLAGLDKEAREAAVEEGLQGFIAAGAESVTAELVDFMRERAIFGTPPYSLDECIQALPPERLEITADYYSGFAEVSEEKPRSILREAALSPAVLSEMLLFFASDSLITAMERAYENEQGYSFTTDDPKFRSYDSFLPPFLFLFGGEGSNEFTWYIPDEVRPTFDAVLEDTSWEGFHKLLDNSSKFSRALTAAADLYGFVRLEDAKREIAEAGLVDNALVDVAMVRASSLPDADYRIVEFDGESYLLYWELDEEELMEELGDDEDELAGLLGYQAHILKRQAKLGLRPLSDMPDGVFEWMDHSEAAEALRAWLDAHVPDGQPDLYYADKIIEELFDEARGPAKPSAFVEVLSERGSIPGDMDDANELIGLAMRFVNDVPRWENAGWSATELGECSGGKRIFYGEDGLPKKVGRNDPCPCGSGKKYKKCCGR